jgi:hypothetical protein
MRERIEYAQMLRKRYGHQIDWQEHGIAEMEEMRSKMIVAANLARQGTNVDWRQVKLSLQPLEGIKFDLATMVKKLAINARSTPKRVLALVQKSQETLQKTGLAADTATLLSAAYTIDGQVPTLGVPNCLAEYVDYRRSGMDHDNAVSQVIADHASGLAYDVGNFRWRFIFDWRSSTTGLGLYTVAGTVENIGKTEFTVPEHGTVMTLVDQESREYSPRPNLPTEWKLRPSIPVPFKFAFEVPVDSRVTSFRIRELDDQINQFGSDRFQVIPVQQ